MGIKYHYHLHPHPKMQSSFDPLTSMKVGDIQIKDPMY